MKKKKGELKGVRVQNLLGQKESGLVASELFRKEKEEKE